MKNIKSATCSQLKCVQTQFNLQLKLQVYLKIHYFFNSLNICKLIHEIFKHEPT